MPTALISCDPNLMPCSSLHPPALLSVSGPLQVFPLLLVIVVGVWILFLILGELSRGLWLLPRRFVRGPPPLHPAFKSKHLLAVSPATFCPPAPAYRLL